MTTDTIAFTAAALADMEHRLLVGVGTAEAVAEYLARIGGILRVRGGSINDDTVREQAKQILLTKAAHLPQLFRFLADGTLVLRPVVGMGACQYGWTDVHPFEVVRIVSEDCIEVREMEATGGLKKDHVFIPGGFVGHVVDQHNAQEWTLTSAPDAPVLRIRLTKRGWALKGQRFGIGRARKFHDYNF